MNGHRSQQYLESLLRELRALPRETEWLEFKRSYADPNEVGEYISALSNSAALVGKATAYLVWGVRDSDHAVVGTTFDPRTAKKGGEELENWLVRLLRPRIGFRFFRLETDAGTVVVAEIERAVSAPVGFAGQEYVRVGSYKKKLKDHPERERALWRTFDRTPFEDRIAYERATDGDVEQLLGWQVYFRLLRMPSPGTTQTRLETLASDGLIRRADAGGWDITNLGAILLAERLRDFPGLRRKSVRVIEYGGDSHTRALRELEMDHGYARGFRELMNYVRTLTPEREVIEGARRRTVSRFPLAAVREIVLNALMHQDFSVTGAGPMVEVFERQLKVTNPGAPLVDLDRLVDAPPRSRNDKLTSLMRRMELCEERGAGVDTVVLQAEKHRLPAPRFEAPGDFTRVTLFARQPLAELGRTDRTWACYLHACVNYLAPRPTTEATVRHRFGIPNDDESTAAALLEEATKAGLVAAESAVEAGASARYLPYWAAGPRPSPS